MHVEAFLDGEIAKLAFADEGTLPHALEYTRLQPLEIFVRDDGAARADIVLADGDECCPTDDKGVIDPVWRICPRLAALAISIKFVAVHYEPPVTSGAPASSHL